MTAPPEQHTAPAPAREAPAVIELGPPPAVTPPPRKARHGSEKRQRSAAVRVRVAPQQQERLKIEAAAAGMSVAGYLASGRLGDEDGADRPRVMRRRRLPKLEAGLLADNNAALNHIGSNLNQTTRAANELVLTGMHSGNERLIRVAEEILDATRRIYADLARTLAANRRACGYDSEG